MVVKLNFKDYALLRQNLEEVEDALTERLLPSKQLKSLNTQMDQNLILLNSLRLEEGDLGEETLSALEERMVSLYGMIHHRYFDSELLSLIDLAKEINKQVNSPDQARLSLSTDHLKNEIIRFKKDYRPDLKQRKILTLLDRFISDLDKRSASVDLLIQQMEQIYLFFDLSTLSQEQADCIIEWCEILDLIERKQTKEARQKLFRLCPELAKNPDNISEDLVWEKIFHVAGLTKTEAPMLTIHKRAIS